LQPDSTSSHPGFGGGYCKDGITPKNKKKYTEDEAKKRAKARDKERAAKATGRLKPWSLISAPLAKSCARAITVTPWVVRYRWKDNENLRTNLEDSNGSNGATSSYS
jgi:hypothetical protein